MATPKYQTLVTHLADAIASGRLRHGERLPPQREMASQFGVTVATITRVISEASRQGLVVARSGSGTFVAAAPATAVVAAPAEDAMPGLAISDVIDLQLNSVPMVPAVAQALRAAMRELSQDDRPEQVFGYQPLAGAARHRDMAAFWLRLRGLEAAGGELLLSHGAQHGMSACLAALTRPGDTVLCEAWVYAGFRRLAAEAGLRLTGVAMDEEGMTPDGLARQLAATGARLVMCSPAMQNPTTATMSLARRREILAVCATASAIVLEDDVYGLLSGDDIPPLGELVPERVVHVTGLSKAVAPGFRLGIIRAPSRLRAAVQEALAVQHWVAPSYYAELLARLVASGSLEGCRREQITDARRRMAVAQQALGPRHVAMPALATYHLWLALPSAWRLDDFVRGLDQRGVRVLPARHFAADETGQVRRIRACLGGVDLPALERGFAGIGRLLDEQPWTPDALI